MLSAQEYIDTVDGTTCGHIHIHCIDLLKHVLQGDEKNTLFGHGNRNPHYLDILRDALEERGAMEDFDVFEDTYQPRQQYRAIKGHDGDFDTDLYMERTRHDSRCFYEDVKQYDSKEAITLLLDGNISSGEVNKKDMNERHKEIYSIVANCESEGTPCRVIVAYQLGLDERKKPLVMYATIKDFNDPIFPGIWGAMKSNKTANAFLNCWLIYFVGTKSLGNGQCQELIVTEDHFDNDEVTAIKAKRITVKNRS